MSTNQTWFDRAKKVLTPNYKQQPLAVVRGEGMRVWDADGKEYLDFLGGVAVNALGHCHPAAVKAITEQAQTLWHASNHYFMPRQVELAEALLRITPFASRVYFCNSGAEANEAMLKLARKYHSDRGEPQRHEIVSTLNSFHGRSLFTVSAGGQPKYQHGFEPLVPGIRHVPYGDVAALEKALDAKTAAFLVEPIQGEAGVILPPPGYLAAARALTRRAGALLCVDEVQTGMGRTGKMWGHEWEDATPDLMSSAKALGGGFPIGALLANEEVGAHLASGSHGSTFGGNPLACAIGLAVLRELQEGGVLERSRAMSARLFEKLGALRAGGRVREVRGKGMLIGIVLQGVLAQPVMQLARERGLLVNAIGEDVVRMAPSLIVSAAEVDEAVSRFAAALAAAPPRG